MELTPQTLRDVEFREKLRGYHPDDVDDFLEEVAVALDGLLARLRTAEAVASGMAPAPAPMATMAQPTDSTLSEGTLSRAILLAQRTADAAIAEAEESARHIMDDARAEADRVLSDTQAKVAAMTEEARAAAEASVGELDQRRAALEREVVSLQTWATKHRDNLREVLSDQLRSLDVWLTSAVPRPPSRPVTRPSMAVGEPTAAMPAVDAADAAPRVGEDMSEAEGATDDGDAPVARRRMVPDSPAAAVSEAVEAGSLASPGGGGDGVALFDQESDATGAPVGRRFRPS